MAQAKTPLEKERRQYFRIKNRLFMGYELLDSNNDSFDIALEQKNSLPFAHLLEELNQLAESNDKHCQSLDSQQQPTIDHLGRVNQKIEQLTGYMIKSLDLDYNELLEVDLSGGGIRYDSEIALKPEQELKLELVLVPEYHYLVALGKVVDCVKEVNGYQIAIAFTHIKENDRDLIVRHVFKSQSQQLRERKQQSEQQ